MDFRTAFLSDGGVIFFVFLFVSSPPFKHAVEESLRVKWGIFFSFLGPESLVQITSLFGIALGAVIRVAGESLKLLGILVFDEMIYFERIFFIQNK